jgi:hypothetical protein
MPRLGAARRSGQFLAMGVRAGEAAEISAITDRVTRHEERHRLLWSPGLTLRWRLARRGRGRLLRAQKEWCREDQCQHER